MAGTWQRVCGKEKGGGVKKRDWSEGSWSQAMKFDRCLQIADPCVVVVVCGCAEATLRIKNLRKVRPLGLPTHNTCNTRPFPPTIHDTT